MKNKPFFILFTYSKKKKKKSLPIIAQNRHLLCSNVNRQYKANVKYINIHMVVGKSLKSNILTLCGSGVTLLFPICIMDCTFIYAAHYSRGKSCDPQCIATKSTVFVPQPDQHRWCSLIWLTVVVVIFRHAMSVQNKNMFTMELLSEVWSASATHG